MKSSLNLSEWALKHRSMVLFLMVSFLIGGFVSYQKLGRAEDPDFTFKAMVIRTLWPGATATEVQAQVTEKIEKRLQDVPWVDFVNSHSKSGESLVFVILKDYTPPNLTPDMWYEVRKKIGDIEHTLPQGVQGPFFNDEFGETFVNIIALTGAGFDLTELRLAAERIARELRQVPDVKKIEFIGVQEERIYVDISHVRLATLGISPPLIFDALQRQNTMAAAGFFETQTDRIRLRMTGAFDSIESVRATSIAAGGRVFRLGDIADVKRGFIDPPMPRMRVGGEPAIGIAISMMKGGDVLTLGEQLAEKMATLKAALPVGIEVHTIADQPRVVHRSIETFMYSLLEAVVIVLAVSCLSLGLRTGVIVALSMAIVLAMTFLCMRIFEIDLQRVSLGALIIALGLLVDDAIIAVEMMVVKMEAGWDRVKAASFAYTSTAFPMLTGTLITAAAFTPVGFARSSSGEYTFSIFSVVSIALLISWVTAVIFTPYLGYKLLNPEKLSKAAGQHGQDRYQNPFNQTIRRLVEGCLRHRWWVIGGTIALFILSIIAFNSAVQRQFFPSSDRTELMIEVWLPQGASLKATEAQTRKIERLLLEDPDMKRTIESFVSYVGNGAPRFYLPLDQQLFNDNFAQFVIMTHDLKAREDLKQRLDAYFEGEHEDWKTGLAQTRIRVLRLQAGPPVGYPVQFRVSGGDIPEVKKVAEAVASRMRENPFLRNINLDWNEMSKSVRLIIDQDRARLLGVSTLDLSNTLSLFLNGLPVTQIRDSRASVDRLLDVVVRATDDERARLSGLADVNIPTSNGRTVPLAQIVRLSYELEDGLISRRDRLPTITVNADIVGNVQAPDLSNQINPSLDSLRETLPPGFSIRMGGAIEESGKGERSIMVVVPVMIFLVLTILMVQLQNMGKTLLVLLTAPLGLIGVAFGLILFNAPFGFVSMLGVIALSGMIMRNSVILVHQIQRDEEEGLAPWAAIVNATVRRFRPIMLTAAAAILAMIPLSRSIFWGPMAIAIMGGLIVATLLTVFFLPALYAAWYRVKP